MGLRLKLMLLLLPLILILLWVLLIPHLSILFSRLFSHLLLLLLLLLLILVLWLLKTVLAICQALWGTLRYQFLVLVITELSNIWRLQQICAQLIHATLTPFHLFCHLLFKGKVLVWILSLVLVFRRFFGFLGTLLFVGLGSLNALELRIYGLVLVLLLLLWICLPRMPLIIVLNKVDTLWILPIKLWLIIESGSPNWLSICLCKVLWLLHLVLLHKPVLLCLCRLFFGWLKHFHLNVGVVRSH